MVVDYFKKLYEENGSNIGRFPIQNGFPVIDFKLLTSMECGLTKQEVRCALFEMAPLKVPRVDRLHAQFYQANWDFVGESIFDMVLKAFKDGQLDDFFY